MDFMAQCLDCKEQPERAFTVYEDRSTWVGDHRVTTGHRVSMWIRGGGQ